MINNESILSETPFRKRVQDCWDLFSKKEAELRILIDNEAESDIITEKLDELLSPAFSLVYAEVGRKNEKYDLTLCLEGDRSRLFSLTYFKRKAPEEVLKHWNIIIGRQPGEINIDNIRLDIGGYSVCADEIQLWCDWEQEEASVCVYCEALVPLLKDDIEQAYNIVYILIDSVIGELAELNYITNLNVIDSPKDENSLKLSEFQRVFYDTVGLTKEELINEERYLESYTGYRMQPDEEHFDGLRKDVVFGISRLMPLLGEFWNNEDFTMTVLFNDGIAAGYLAYPLDSFNGVNRGEQILHFREMVTEKFESASGKDSFEFIGGATGIYYGYIDFIAWDLKEVLDKAVSIFKETDIERLIYHSFIWDDDEMILYQ